MKYLYLFKGLFSVGLLAILVLSPAYTAYSNEIELEPITVSLQPFETEGQDQTKNISILYPEESPAASFEDILEQEAGVDISKRSIFGIQSDLSIRGATAQQTNISVNGILLNDPQTAHHNLDLAIPDLAMEKMTVIRGASSQIWSQSAIGGAVDITTKRPVANEGSMFFEYGTDETQTSSLYLSLKNEASGINFSVQEATSNGWRFDTDFKEFAVSSSGLLEVGDNISSYLFAGYGEKEFGAADFYGPYNSKEWTDTLFVNWSTDIKVERFNITPKIYYRRHHDKYMLDIARPDYYLNHHRTIIKGMQVEAEADLLDFGLVTAGVDINRQSIESTNLGDDSRGRDSYSLSYRNYQNKVFGYDASIRIDDYSEYNTQILPQAGVFFKPLPWIKLRSSAAKAARPPGYTELFYDSSANKGNKNLSTEKSVSYEAGIDFILKDNEDIALSFTAFRRDCDDLIDWIKTPLSPDFYEAANIARTKTEGIEAELDAKFLKWLRIKMSYSYINSDIDQAQNYISKYALNHPDHKVFAQTDIILPFGIQNIRLLYKNKEGYSSYLLLGATLNYNLNKYSTIFITGENLTNEVYWDIRDNILPGREIFCGAKIRF